MDAFFTPSLTEPASTEPLSAVAPIVASPGPAFEILRAARKVGYVLSGGSARCAFQVGVIEALGELGIRPGVCVAVSGGVWNAAAVAAGTSHRLRAYWRTFSRLPHVDLTNLWREHSPYRFNEMHRRTFRRFIGAERLKSSTVPMLAGVSRLRDRTFEAVDVRSFDDPLLPLLASNYLPPFYTHAPRLRGERYGDGGLVDNLPYEHAFRAGCDAVVLVTQKGESEGLPYRNPRDPEHRIPPEYAARTIVIRPRHRLPANFTERRWPVLAQTMDLGRMRTREVLLGERHEPTEVVYTGNPWVSLFSRFMMTRVLAVGAQRRA
jgi:predicted acylesterase/phospholipase RssA